MDDVTQTRSQPLARDPETASDPASPTRAGPGAPARLDILCFLFDPNIGGPTIRARSVYERMIAAGHSVRVAFPRGDGPAPGYMAAGGIAVDRLDIAKPVLPRKPRAFLAFAATFPVAVFRLWRYLRRRRPDVIHVNGAFDVGPAIAGRLAGLPVVWHLNDTLFSPRVSRLMGRIVTATATQIVAAAERVAAHYGVIGGTTRILPAPVDTHRFTARDPARPAASEPVIGLVGNWTWVKGQDRFVELIEALRRDGRLVRGRVMGRLLERQRDYWEPIIARVGETGLDAALDVAGFVEDTAAALRELDLLVLTSQSEACPMCVLEGMAVGVPPVVFDVGGVREMLGEGAEAAGIVVPAGDVPAMAEAVARLLDDPALYRRMSEAGQRRARARFSLEACVERHEAAYRAAISRSKGAPA